MRHGVSVPATPTTTAIQTTHWISGSRLRAPNLTTVPASRDLLPCELPPSPGILRVMYSDGSALQQLSREECLMLMASVPVGRIIYTRRALPAGLEACSPA